MYKHAKLLTLFLLFSSTVQLHALAFKRSLALQVCDTARRYQMSADTRVVRRVCVCFGRNRGMFHRIP